MTKFIFAFLLLLLTACLTQAGSADNWKDLNNKMNSPFDINSQAPDTNKTQIIHLKYISSQAANKLITKHTHQLFTNKTTVIALQNQHALWAHGSSRDIRLLRQFIALIDHSTPQIKISARVVTIDRRYLRSLGIEFKTTTVDGEALQMNMPQSSTRAGTALITIARLGNNKLLDMQISALEKSGHAHVIAQPILITKNNQAAIIESGQEVPYQQSTSSGATNIAFKKAVLRLSVTPELINRKQILCHIDIHQDKVSPINVQGVPIISTQHIKTNARINNQHTLVLGGILNQTDENHVEGIPGLSKIPLLGNLFKHTRHQHTEQQLLIFVTPSIVK
ncbi:MAG: secretin [Coxiellaceae bacterium]|nr:secretin [Coxiellaceae bacterium]